MQSSTHLGDHWTWRPEWRVDRPHLMWYLPCGHEPALQEWLRRARDALDGAAGLDVVPDQWLHCTIDDVGFVDELPPEQVGEVARVAQETLCDWTVPYLTLDAAAPMRDALVLGAGPVDELTRLRDALRAATVSVIGDRVLPRLEVFRPHVSFAYANRPTDAGPLLERLSTMTPTPVHVSPPVVTLAAVTRRDRHYQWTAHSEVRAGQPAGRR